MSITVYSAKSCSRCFTTKKALDKAGLSYEVVDVDKDEATRNMLTERYGYSALPVVVVDDPNAGEWHWSGFRYDAIRSLAS